MKRTKTIFVLLLVSVGATSNAFSQSTDEVKGLRRDIDSVRDSLKLIQSDLETIKKLLQQPVAAAAQPQAFKESVISVDGAPFLGKKDAKVTVIEFSDYQCPFCARHVKQTMPELMKEYVATGKVKWVFRDYPLENLHPQAFKGAEASRCAGEQGKFWEMHDRLFENQTKMAPADLVEHAKALGLNGEKFNQCLESGKYAAKVRADLADGGKAGVRGTPGFFIGLTEPGSTIKAVKFINGAQPLTNFKENIDALLLVAAN